MEEHTDGSPPSKKPRNEDEVTRDVIEGSVPEVSASESNKYQNLKAEVPDSPTDYPLLKEEDVGITEYISLHKGFNGVIKQRYSDFLVNEISETGDVVHLTDLSAPQTESKNEDTSTNILNENWMMKLKEVWNSKDKKKDVLLEAGEDKAVRCRIHEAVRNAYPGLESSTVNKDGVTYIRVFHKVSGRQGKTRAEPWPRGRGDYCRFVLYKENKDTMEAIFLIAKYLRMKAGSFTFAGTKDRRAITCQEVTVYRVSADLLHSANKLLRNIVLGNFRYCDSPLKLGDLRGNRFTVILRNINGDSEEIKTGVHSLSVVGFINYYGMQRFGTTSVPTHSVGRALMKGSWQDAVELILKPRGGGNDELYEARKIWWETKDPKKALKMLGNKVTIEKQLLMGLCKYKKNDLVSALNMIPRNSRLMYVHSYQSYIWNVLVSRRIRKFGLKPIVGDLVSSHTCSIGNKQMEVQREEQASTEPQVIRPETIDSWSIQQVVMPLPGWDVQYPQNEVGGWYTEMLVQDNLSVTALKHRVRDYSLAGAYRHIVVKPEDVNYEFMSYDDVTLPLVLGDHELLTKVPAASPVKAGKFRALKLEFSLPSSTYATMALREVLKSDTSAAHQSTLNVT